MNKLLKERLESAATYCQQQAMTQLERIVVLEDELGEALIAMETKDIEHQMLMVEIRGAIRPIIQNAPMILDLATPEDS